MQVVTALGGWPPGLSPALPGRTHDLRAARTHRIIRIREQQGVPVAADLAHQGAGPWPATGINLRPLQELAPTDRTRKPRPGRGTRTRRTWRCPPDPRRIFRRSQCGPNHMTSNAKAVLTQELQRRKGSLTTPARFEEPRQQGGAES
ncbi:hypothetical protein GCM10023329_57410 [Streptomyces sanyensis]|uniref:Transposase n=1 Tax=Streptomyces sanyensis TaxID=568869 RepID=A0ABP9BL28_9ACTN